MTLAYPTQSVIGPDTKRLQDVRTEENNQRHVGGVPAMSHDHPANAGNVVTWIERHLLS
jgi:hypothetical protein